MKQNFTQIENILIKDNGITDSEFRTYLVLRSYKYGELGEVYPSQKRISLDRGLTSRSIISHVKSLASKGYIKYSRRGYNLTNLYEFGGEEIFTSIVKSASLSHRRNLHSKNTELNNTNTKNRVARSQIIEEIRKKHSFLQKNRTLSNT